jgi:molybdopterin/thiamine biosynthesis adenylyltransferase
LPKSFPDEFPKIFIDQLSYEKLFPAPHINWDRSICTYNNFTRPNPDYPVEIVQETINKAKEIIKDILTGKDLTNEYLEEITHYWNWDVEGQIHSLIEPGETPCRIYLGKKAAGTSIVAAASIKEVQDWYRNLGVMPKDIEINPGIYVPELDYGVPPFPKNNGQWVKTISRKSQKLIKEINEIFNDCDWPVTLIFSKSNSDLTTWGAIKFERKAVITTNARKKHYRKQGVNGFRDGTAPFSQELRAFASNKVAKLAVEPVYSSRLQTRGGEGPRLNNKTSVMVVGCGSIGSHLAELLVQSGLNNISFVDPDSLSFGNIARHVCGANQVGENKARALAHELGLRFPHVRYQDNPKSIFDVLLDECERVNRHDLIICATGEYNIEARLSQNLYEGYIHKPAIIVWVEPYLVAGHAIYLTPKGQGCFECVFNYDDFTHKVLASSQEFTKREAGCSSLYLPYGIIKVQSFVARLTDFVFKMLSSPPDENLIWTWTGDLDEARSMEFRLSQQWREASNYSVYLQKLSVKMGCVCQNVNYNAE